MDKNGPKCINLHENNENLSNPTKCSNVTKTETETAYKHLSTGKTNFPHVLAQVLAQDSSMALGAQKTKIQQFQWFLKALEGVEGYWPLGGVQTPVRGPKITPQ